MSDIYEPQQIERETQQYWEDQGLFSVTEDLSKEKFYCLAMLPYPSGKLHMGHVRNYTISDVIARYQRMLGKNVLQPMGWDAFGLPAENAAIQNQVAPAKWTYENIKEMRTQFKRLGFAFDWRRELATCRPEFYRWEQWFFTKLFEKGLVYKKSAMINWDPVDETILANEQVIDGRGWRSGALVERREIPQWFLKITHYAEELLNGLDGLPGWPDEVRTMQRNWIGRSEGALVQFEVLDQTTSIEVFTTRVDTLFGVNYLAVAPQHPLALQAATNNPALQLFIDECRAIPTAEAVVATLVKRGQDTGVRVRHPLTGDILPVWAANFVLMDYGTGAVMAVPAHDERDFEFAQKYDLPISPVITLSAETEHDYSQAALITTAGTLINSGEFNGLDYDAARLAITAHLIKLNKGCQKLSYRLRDWSVSRQRYWGTPVPIIHCASCGAVAVPEAQLPVLLPENISFSGASSPLKDLPEFYNTNCPKCGGEAQRETDTFDTFMESSWYYARYTCRNQEQAMLDDRAKYWLPVDQYIGGIEHAVMHLLYARFYHKLLRDAGLVNSDEPFTRLLTQGMVLKDGAKMSKSKGNTVDPNHLIAQYGADTVRLFVMFAAPPEHSLEWSDSGVEGAHRFLKRLWQFGIQHKNLAQIKAAKLTDSTTLKAQHAALRRQLHELLQQARYDYERQQFNTVVSGCMKMLNLLQDAATALPQTAAEELNELQTILQEGFSILLRLLAPITPHITHTLWQLWGMETIILNAKFPKPAADALKNDVLELVVQINGKLRGQINIDANADAAAIEAAALANETIQRHLDGKAIKKIIIVPKKLINIVA